MKKITGLFLCLLLVLCFAAFTAEAEEVAIDETNFPDEAFRTYVAQFDKDENGSFSSEELAAVTKIDLQFNYTVASLKGIEQFSSLKSLCVNITSKLKSLDLSGNPNLQILYCGDSGVEEVNIRKNAKLRAFHGNNAKLKELDLTGCPELVELYCGYNEIAQLDLSQNTKIERVYCHYNQLTELDLSNNPKVWLLICGGNKLTSLNVSHLKLSELSCYENQLTSLNLTKNTGLYELYCNGNPLTSLDLSKCVNLKQLECYDTELTTLNLNGCPQLLDLADQTAAAPYDYYQYHHYGWWEKDEDGWMQRCIFFDKGVNVIAEMVHVQAITLNETELVFEADPDEGLYFGKQAEIRAAVSPENATITDREWSSSDEEVATVDQYGRVESVGYGECTITCSATDRSGVKAECKVIVKKPAPVLTKVKFDRKTVTVKTKAPITAVTSTNVVKLTMYNGNKAVTTWTDGYTDDGDTRTWTETYSFSGAGERTLSFKAFNSDGEASEAKTATVTVTEAPTISGAKFTKEQATVKQKVTVKAVTSDNVVQLNMYSGKTLAKSWTGGYTDKDGKRTWNVTLTFSTKGANRKLIFKGQDANGALTAGKAAYITITAAPTLSGVKFAKTSILAKQSVTIKAVTNTMATKLTMIYNGKTVQSWTDGYTDADGKRTWKVTYTFSGKGTKTLSFKAYDANGAATAKKQATITVTVPEKVTLSSVKFAVATAKVKEKVTIKAVTSTNVTQLNMYSGKKLVKSWTKGYTDKDGKRTWKVTYAFGGAGADRKLTFKGQDASGTLSAGKDAVITITK